MPSSFRPLHPLRTAPSLCLLACAFAAFVIPARHLFANFGGLDQTQVPIQDLNVVGGSGVVVASNIHHPNGNIYDQVLMTGPSVSVVADPGQGVRTSFIDDNDDITQVEFSGSGTVTITIDSATYQPPAPPLKYIQPGVNYVKGHATVRVQYAASDSNIAIFSVGRGNAVNQGLFPEGMTYDGMADLQLLRIDGAQLGAVFAGDVRFSSDSGATGIQAPSTAILHRVAIGDVTASDVASPIVRIAAGSTLDLDSGAVRIAGGRLFQANNAPVDVSSETGYPLAKLMAVDGGLSSGDVVPAGSITARFSSRLPGSVSVNGSSHATRGLLPSTFDEVLAESGLNTLDFGDVGLHFSGGNNGTYTLSENDYIEDVYVALGLTGGYSYAVSGANLNVMTFSMTLTKISFSAGTDSFSGTPRQFADLAGVPAPTRVTAVVQLDSSVSGTATIRIDYTSGPSDSYSDYFDLDHELDFGFF
ncbi:MAG TPA: hypothetical protein VHE13_00480 [Opitutus sp.]|nr:hypothetical protein [Opitutus sp.]